MTVLEHPSTFDITRAAWHEIGGDVIKHESVTYIMPGNGGTAVTTALHVLTNAALCSNP